MERMVTGKQSRRLFGISIVNFLALVVLWWFAYSGGEDLWFVALITLVPQQVFVLPTLVLALVAATRRNWRVLLLQLPAFAFLLFGFLSFNLPWPRLQSASTPSSKALRVMTYNIRSGSLGIREIGGVITRANPDVICLQEATGKENVPYPIPVLKKVLGNYQLARYSEFTTFSRYPVFSKRNHPLPTFEGFGALETQLDVQGQRLAVFNVHVTNLQKGPPFAQPDEIRKPSNVRGEQVELVSTLAEQSAMPTIVAGDFNLPPRGPLYRRLAKFHQDAFGACNFGYGYTYPAVFPVMRIDYIWSGHGAKPVSCRTLATRASDHRPVVAEIVLPARSPAAQSAG